MAACGRPAATCCRKSDSESEPCVLRESEQYGTLSMLSIDGRFTLPVFDP